MEMEILKKFAEEGLSFAKIAKKLNCSTTKVRYWATIYNIKTKRSILEVKYINCLFCKKSIKLINNQSKKYCSKNCQQNYILENSVKNNTCSPRSAKRYLLKINPKCSVCNRKKWNNQNISLEIDHMDGNSSNNNLSNLRLICPNCHSQTCTYKNKNKGKGRYSRRLRYQEGKSF